MGTFFVLPVYLQVVLGLDAFETGKRLLPMSVTMLDRRPGRAEARQRGWRRDRSFGSASSAMAIAALVLVADDRDRAERDRLQALAGPVRRRGGSPDVPARERDHVLGPAREDERGRGAAGNGPEPRRLARDGTDRLCPPDGSAHRLQRPDRAEPGSLGFDQGRSSAPRPRRGSRSSRPSRSGP